VSGALADHIATLTPEKVERIHRDARGREKDDTLGGISRYASGRCASWLKGGEPDYERRPYSA
jgi:hypothetical protein